MGPYERKKRKKTDSIFKVIIYGAVCYYSCDAVEFFEGKIIFFIRVALYNHYSLIINLAYVRHSYLQESKCVLGLHLCV